VLIAGGCTPSGEELRERAAQNMAAGDPRAAMVDLKTLLKESPDDASARLELGKALLALGDAKMAVTELVRARDLGVQGFELRATLARAWLASQEFERAVAEADPETAATDLERRELLLIQGQSLLSLRRDIESEAAFRRALELEPRHVPTLLGLAIASHRLHGLDAGRKYIDEALAVDPRSIQARLTLGQLLLADGRTAEAEAVFQELVNPALGKIDTLEALSAHSGLAEAQIAQGKIQPALATTDALRKAAPDLRTVLLLRVRALLLVKDYPQARELLESFIARNPDDQVARLLLGGVNYAQGNFEQADMHLASVIAVEPANALARKLLAETRLRLEQPGETQQALQAPAADPAGAVQELAVAVRSSDESRHAAAGLSKLESVHAAYPADARVTLALASAYLGAGQHDKAIALLEGVPINDDSDSRHTVMLAVAYAAKGEQELSRSLLQQLSGESDKSADTLTMMADAWAALGELDEARRRYASALQIAPDHSGALVGFARMQIAAGELLGAEQRLRRVLSQKPRDLPALLAMAELAIARRDPTTAVNWLTQARDAAPDAVNPRLLLAQYYLAARDPVRARESADELIKLAPENAEAYNVLGLALLALRQPQAASIQFETATRLANKALYHANLARAQLALGDRAAARAAVAQALKMEPESITALALEAQILARERRFDRALEQALQIQRAYPQQATGFVLAGEIHMQRNAYAEAEAAFSAAAARERSPVLSIWQYRARRLGKLPTPLQPLEDWVAAQPADSRMWLVLAQARQEAGATPAAAEAYARVLELAPNDVVALNNLAWLYYTAGDSRGLDLAKQAFSLRPKSPAVADTYGWLLAESGESEKALPILRVAAAATGAEPDVRYHLAVVLARTDRAAEARTVLAQLLGSGEPFESEVKARQLLLKLSESG
jgi:putative PEP-CTERM system TPR-repeat lipoprotein